MKYLAASILLCLSAVAHAGELQLTDDKVFKTEDASQEAQLCLAALESKDALKHKARELKVGHRTLKKVMCNDMTLVEFAKAHRDDMREWSIATVQ